MFFPLLQTAQLMVLSLLLNPENFRITEINTRLIEELNNFDTSFSSILKPE